jgi:hypothetical protein
MTCFLITCQHLGSLPIEPRLNQFDFLRIAVFSRALNYDTEKSDLSTFKNFFFAVCFEPGHG